MAALPPLRDLIRALIGTPSVSSVVPAHDTGNRAVIELLATWLEDLGFAIELQPLPGRDHKLNLIARRGGSGADGLVLAGHTDTVPCDPALWRDDPFRLRERDDRLYGLGTADMKGFLCIVVDTLRGQDLASLRRPLTVLATADEESGMHGAHALLARGQVLGAHGLIGEPTGLRPVHRHKGIFMEAVRVIGRSGHSSDPALGRNALEGLHRVLGALLALRAELEDRYRDPAFTPPTPTLNFGHVHGGDNANRICGQCELHLDLRPLPGMDIAELRELLRARARAALDGTELRCEFEALYDGLPALDTPRDAHIVRLAEQLSGAASEAVSFGTEAPYYSRLGTETVVCGPGHIAQAHQPDEYLPLAEIAPTQRMLGGLIDAICRA